MGKAWDNITGKSAVVNKAPGEAMSEYDFALNRAFFYRDDEEESKESNEESKEPNK